MRVCCRYPSPSVNCCRLLLLLPEPYHVVVVLAKWLFSRMPFPDCRKCVTLLERYLAECTMTFYPMHWRDQCNFANPKDTKRPFAKGRATKSRSTTIK